jgi:hypothetical protein
MPYYGEHDIESDYDADSDDYDDNKERDVDILEFNDADDADEHGPTFENSKEYPGFIQDDSSCEAALRDGWTLVRCPDCRVHQLHL